MADLRMSLRELSLREVRETEREIGRGAYGVVKEYIYKGLRCAGKEIHHEFTEADSEQSVRIIERFEEECLHLSKLHHPNIVLFMGVYFKEGALFPALIMELFPMSLDGALTKYPNIPPYIKNYILYDIACGLSFLHGQDPPLIHRDLSSKNVLLTDNFRAKIADLGMSRVDLLIPQGDERKLTEVPGNAFFMPPEAFHNDPVYDHSLDIFSYGNIILNTVNQTWPRPGARETKDRAIVAEIDRRKVDLEEMGETHPLRKLTERCLAERGADRPSAVEAVEVLFKQIEANTPPFSDALQMMQQLTRLSNEASQREGVVNALKEEKAELQRTSTAAENEKNTLRMQVATLNVEISDVKSLLKMRDDEVGRLAEEKQLKENMIRTKEGFIDAIKNENAALKSESKIALLGPTSSLKWESCAPLPHPRKHVQAVQFKGKVYIGSGYGATNDISRQVYCYVPESDEWVESVESLTRNFSMTVFGEDLLLIGGVVNEKDFSKQVQVLTHDGKKFVFYKAEDMPEMNNARAGAVSFSLSFNIIVAGGYRGKDRLISVEVYDRHYKMWFPAPKLPCKCAELKAAIAHGDQCYLLGGSNQYNHVFTASLKNIIGKSVTPLMGERTNSNASESDSAVNGDQTDVWTTIADVPYDFCFVSLFGGSLVALGGEKDRKLLGPVYFTQISVYNNSKGAWIHVADLPVGLSKATAVTLRSGDMLVIGGRSHSASQVESMFTCKLACSRSCTEEQ